MSVFAFTDSIYEALLFLMIYEAEMSKHETTDLMNATDDRNKEYLKDIDKDTASHDEFQLIYFILAKIPINL